MDSGPAPLTGPCRVLKVSLLALYLQFLPKGRFRSGTYVTAVVVILFTIGTVLVRAYAEAIPCQPEVLTPETRPHCFNANRFLPLGILSRESVVLTLLRFTS